MIFKGAPRPWFFGTGFYGVALAVLEHILRIRLALNSEVCVPLPSERWD